MAIVEILTLTLDPSKDSCRYMINEAFKRISNGFCYELFFLLATAIDQRQENDYMDGRGIDQIKYAEAIYDLIDDNFEHVVQYSNGKQLVRDLNRLVVNLDDVQKTKLLTVFCRYFGEIRRTQPNVTNLVDFIKQMIEETLECNEDTVECAEEWFPILLDYDRDWIVPNVLSLVRKYYSPGQASELLKDVVKGMEEYAQSRPRLIMNRDFKEMWTRNKCIDKVIGRLASMSYYFYTESIMKRRF